MNKALKGVGIRYLAIVDGKIHIDNYQNWFSRFLKQSKGVQINAESSFRANPPTQSFNIWK